MSDDVGFIYPTVTINCKSSGTLTLSNSATSVNTVIKNCSNGETITINGDTLNVTTNKSNHKIYDDFNYEFFMIGNTINERRNRISASIPCELEIRYNPIIKDLP
jgi:phage-related protein